MVLNSRDISFASVFPPPSAGLPSPPPYRRPSSFQSRRLGVAGEIFSCCCCCRNHPWAHLPRPLPAAPTPTPHKVTNLVRGGVRPPRAAASPEWKGGPRPRGRPRRRGLAAGHSVGSSGLLSHPALGPERRRRTWLSRGTRRVGLGRGRLLKGNPGRFRRSLFGCVGSRHRGRPLGFPGS